LFAYQMIQEDFKWLGL